MSKGRKIVVGLLVALLLIVIVAFVTLRWFTTQALPKTRGTVEVAGISEAVEIVRDEFGVAHIYADNPHDLFFAQGYIHAQERFWQMEFQRRTATGRLSEFFGDATLEIDKYLRHFGFPELAQQDYDNLDEVTREKMDAYVAGVNAYIQDRSPAELGLEFAILSLQGADITVEPWTPVSSMSWAYMMVLEQSGLGGTAEDIMNADLLNTVGAEMYAELRPAYREDRPVIIPTEELIMMGLPTVSLPDPDPVARSGIVTAGEPLAESKRIQSPLAAIGFTNHGGSNSFVFSGDKTTTGTPILANDTHMLIQAPSLFYQIGLHCRQVSEACPENMRGFSLAGVPGTLIGHNDHIAWGLTNAAFDSEDVFIEKVNPDNPDQYEVNGEWVDMDIHQEEILVSGQDNPETVTVRRTRNGVVASDYLVDPLEFDLGDGWPEPYAIVYASTALEPMRTLQAVSEVNVAQNWQEFNDALSKFDAGKQNLLYADVEGNIGFVMPGKVPIRAAGDGTMPVPGWNDDYTWTGFIPYEDMPRTVNPEKGFIVTANQPQVVEADYPYLLGKSQDRGQRAERINQRVAADTDGISIEDVMAFQTDGGSVSALEIIPYLDGLTMDYPAAAEARDRLLSWDAVMGMDSSEAVVYNYFWDELLAQIFRDQLPERHWPYGGPADADTVYHLLEEPNNKWWDDAGTAGVESRDDILASAFVQGYARAVADLGKDSESWRWGEIHTIIFESPTLGQTGIGLIDNIFNRGPYETNGSSLVPQNTAWIARSESFEVGWIPHIREVIDLGSLADSWMINQLGQSGHPMHAQYDNFVDKWRFFEYIPNNWLREDAETGKSDLLTLEPAP